MSLSKFKLFAVTGFACTCLACHATQVYQFANVVGSTIQFNGVNSSFQFNPNGLGNDWAITSESGQPSGSVLGLSGAFLGGPWTYGTITTSFGGMVQTANVNPLAASLSINDGAGFLATADVVWGVISTFQNSGALNASLTVNLSSLHYGGLNTDLLAFFSNPAGSLDVTFNFNPNGTLTQLSSGPGPYTAAFSGSLTPAPEPATWALLLTGLAGLGFMRNLRRKS